MIKHDKPGKAFSNMLDEIFNNSFSDIVGANITSKRPAVNIYDKEDGYFLELAAPGLQKDSFDISVHDKELTISANVVTEEGDKQDAIKKEFDFRSFTRKFILSEEVDTDSITASYVDGVLIVTLAKKNIEKADLIKKIEIA